MLFGKKREIKIPVEVSARHVHLSQKDLEALFGLGYRLKKFKDLTQPGDFAAEELLGLRLGGKEIKGVRVVGPLRKETQVEISMTDALYLKINPVLKISGDIQETPGIVLKNEANGREIEIGKGVIIPLRHLHCNLKEAKEMGLANGQRISVKIEGERGIVFNNVEVRTGDGYLLSMHIDTDEGNAAGINKKSEGVIL